MLVKIYFTFTKLKNSKLNIILNSVTEKQTLLSNNLLVNNRKKIRFFFFNMFFDQIKERQVANIVLKDMIGLIITWRQIRGYPSSGSTTHTNAKTSRKNKLLMQYRLSQFFQLFGNKKRNIYPTLIKAEYNNRLWRFNWEKEWSQARRFVIRMLEAKGQKVGFNPALLASNQTNGYTRVGKAAKIGKAKKITKAFTIGVPVFFTRFIYYEKIPSFFSYRLTLRDEVNKKLGKKTKKKK